MIRSKRSRVLLVALCLGTPAGGVLAGEVVERSEVVVLGDDCVDCSVRLVYAWSYHPGDDPAWADPEFDDTDWPLVLPSLRDAQTILGGWPGIGWFRRRLRVTEDFGDTVGIHMAQAGASEIYLDGRLVARFGTVSTDPRVERTQLPQYVASLTVSPGSEHVLAVRYSNVTGNVFKRNFRGFEMRMGDMQSLSAEGVRIIRRYFTVMGLLAGVFGALMLLHLLLFAFQPRATENLFFTVFTASMLGMLLAEIKMESVSDLAQMLVYYKWFMTGAVAMALSALLLEYKVFKYRIGMLFYLLLAGAAAALIWIWARPALGGMMPAVLYLALVYLLTLWQAMRALIDRQPEAWVIGLGLAALTLSIFAVLAMAAGWIELPEWIPLIGGFGTLTVCFSVYLTRRVARLNRELAAKLNEVQQLTAKTIEQERRAAQEEADRRVLEADNRRKTEELEEARRLQLAMLPAELPRLESFAIAVHMSTANEVGGDYYDFSANGDGSCTLVVGDATGHGLHAGMVVGAAKSLFQTCSHEDRLAKVLERIESGLSAMHRREASMAMLLVRLNAHCLRVASAGMPPLLVWRKASGRIEEVMLPSVPLGTLARSEFQEASLDLRTGDSVLIMTDGLAEVVDPEGNLLGYERAAELFAGVAHLDPQQAIAGLLEQAAAHHAGTPLEDDMTLVVLKALG